MSFLSDYLDYASGNEAPEMFHVYAGYSVLSAAISRKVWLPYGDEAIYPNVYVIFVGDAGNGKSMALRKAKRMLSELGSVPISRSVETPEGLWRFMAGDPKTNPPTPSPVRFSTAWPDGIIRDCHPMTIIANEFVNFIGKDEKGWMNALNDIYDEDNYEYRTKNCGEDNLLGPYIVLLGALTTDVSADLQKERVIASGFARRTIFQYGERQWHNPHAIPEFDDAQKEVRQRCVDYARELTKVQGTFYWSKETQDWWETWYQKHLSAIPTAAPHIKHWLTSKHVQLLKIAMLTSLSESVELVINIDHIETALAFLDRTEQDLYKVFGGVGRNELASVAVRIYEYVQGRTVPIPMKQMKSMFWTSCKPPNDLNQCLEYLKTSGKIKEAIVQVPGYAAESVIATPEVMQQFLDDAKSARQRAATGNG